MASLGGWWGGGGGLAIRGGGGGGRAIRGRDGGGQGGARSQAGGSQNDTRARAEQKVACFLYAGISALAASSPEAKDFELSREELCPEGEAVMYATMILKCIISDLEGRENAPPTGKPSGRKAGRYEQVVVCSTPQHRLVLADCLTDAFTAFTSNDDEAKTRQAEFKPKVARPNRA